MREGMERYARILNDVTELDMDPNSVSLLLRAMISMTCIDMALYGEAKTPLFIIEPLGEGTFSCELTEDFRNLLNGDIRLNILLDEIAEKA